MDNQKTTEKIADWIDAAKVSKRRGHLKKHEAYDEIIKITSFLPSSASVSQRLWHMCKNTDVVPTCSVCNANPCAWDKEGGGRYRNTCSHGCSLRSSDRRSKIDETNLQKYGSRSPFGSRRIQKKSRKTVQEKYNVDNISQHADVKSKIKQTLFNTRNKNANSKQQIVGLINQNLNQQQMGVALGITQPRVSNLLKKLSLTTNVNTSSPQVEIYDYLRSILPEETIIQNDRTTLAPNELDIFLPNLKIAIEIDGIYWHSELAGKNKNYHLDKTISCQALGIQLIHVFSSEWTDKPSVVKSRLASIFGKQQNRTFARRGTVITIDHRTSKQFVEAYHTQGHRPSSINLALTTNNEIVAVMTFSKIKNGKCELIRFCCKNNTHVVGAAGKMFAFFVSHYNPGIVLSYADRRWSVGNVYQQLGFSFDGFTAPNYWYFNRQGNTNILFSRVAFQKHKLPMLLEGYRDDLTEWENMKMHGYDRIWDCGSSRWIWTKK